MSLPCLEKRPPARTAHTTMGEIVLLVCADLLDSIASRIRTTGIEVVLAPPNGIRLQTEFDEAADVQFFPGLTETSAAKVTAALLDVSYEHLTTTLLPGRPLLPLLPFETQSGAYCHVNHGTFVQMLYECLPGPRESLLGPSKGGVWVFWSGVKKSGVKLEGTGLEDSEIMEVAEARMEGVDTY